MSDPITVREASSLVNTPATTIRKWIQLGQVNSIGKQGKKHLIDRNELLTFVGKKRENQPTKQQEENELITIHKTQLDLYKSKIDLLERTLEREQSVNDSMREHIQSLIREQATLTAEIKALLENEVDTGFKLPFRWRRG